MENWVQMDELGYPYFRTFRKPPLGWSHGFRLTVNFQRNQTGCSSVSTNEIKRTCFQRYCHASPHRQEAHNCSGTKTGGNWKRIFSTRKAVFTCFYLVVACGRQIDEFGFFCCISVSHHFSPKHETSRNAIIIPGWRTGLNWRHAIWQKLHQFHLHLPPV